MEDKELLQLAQIWKDKKDAWLFSIGISQEEIREISKQLRNTSPQN